MEVSQANNITKYSNFQLIINDNTVTIETSEFTPATTLNDYLRDHLYLTGTKFMCKEGGCGVCLVAATIKNPTTGIKETLAVNSCLVSILSCAGWEIRTIEGLGSRADGYDPIQQKIVQFNGTQCGFCTPGMVMNMHCLREADKMTMAEIENSFGGNICRCTGYRPILAAFKSMASNADVEMLGSIPDIEELNLCEKKILCTKQCGIFAGKMPCIYEVKKTMLHIDAEINDNWYNVSQIKEIFDIFNSRKKDEYMLVAGNTAKGVYWNINKADYYININNVAELKNFNYAKDKLTIGASTSLADTMKLFQETTKHRAGFEYLKKFAVHIDLVATVAVRNIGTIAGNLSIKHAYNEFPSDIFLLLETINAKLKIDNGSKTKLVSPKQYLDEDMTRKILTSIEIPVLDASYRFESYKIMPKSQNAHAYVNAGFLFQLTDTNVVKSARIVYGGIRPDFVHATDAENYIVGKQLFNNNNMKVLFDKLNGQITPDARLPDASPVYRKNLAIALMYKFILANAPLSMLTEANKSGGFKLLRPAVSRGVQQYETDESMYPLGEPLQKAEAVDQAAGEAKYTGDLPDLPNQLFAGFVLAEAPAGAVLKSIDATLALKTPGVEAFYQASDITVFGGVNSFTPPETNLPENEWIFLPINTKVEYYYQPIGVMFADSQQLAEEAALMVKANYKLPTTSPLSNVREVLEHRADERITHDTTIPPQKQNKDVGVKLKGSFDCSWQYHYHMETQTANIVPDDDGGYIIHPSSQWLDAIQAAVSGALKITANKLTISVKRLGGGFGGKNNRTGQLVCAAMLGAINLRRPVKIWMPFHINMNVMGKRAPASADYEIGVDTEGQLGYLNLKVYTDVGLHANDNPKSLLLNYLTNTYRSEATQIDYNLVRTDRHSTVWMRAPGTTEAAAMMEDVWEQIACKLKKDPLDVKLANINFEKHPMLKSMLEEFVVWTDYRKRRGAIEQFNAKNRWRKKGIALMPMAFGFNFFGCYDAQVSIFQADGSVAISHGGIEMGQGINTKAMQVVAYTLGIEMKMISVQPTCNLTAPNSFTTGISQTSEAVCMAILRACKRLKTDIDNAVEAAKLPKDSPWVKKVQKAHETGVKLTDHQMFYPDDPSKYSYQIYGISTAEIELDVLTGNFIVQRVDIMQDAGECMNPTIDIGQVEGAFVMGQGYWTTEEMIVDHNGRLMTNRSWNYKPPGAKDIPVDFRVKFPSVANPISPLKCKAIGEPPLILSYAIPLSLKHAIGSARIQSDATVDPWTETHGPATVERNFLNCLNTYKQYTL